MQISSLLRRQSSPLHCLSSERGFTLIELLISAAIITVISSLVLVRFTSFDGAVILRGVAYDVATAVREAQIYSVSIVNTGSGSSANFRYPYGISFTPGLTSYVFFRFDSNDSSIRPAYGVSDSVSETIVRAVPLGGSFEVYQVGVKRTGVAEEYKSATSSGNKTLDISFRRPEFAAIFNANWLSSAQQSEIEYARIFLRSRRDTGSIWVVEVKLLGQITLYKH